MEKEDKNLEEFENLDNTNNKDNEEVSDISSSLFDDSSESMFENTASMFDNVEETNTDDGFEDFPTKETEETIEEIQEEQETLVSEIKEESAQEIAEKITKEIKEAAKEITEEFQEQIQKPSNEMPDFLNETHAQENETKQIETAENYVSTIDDFEEEQDESEKLITVRPVKFQQFENTPPNRAIKKNLDIMQDVSMHVSVELGRTKSSIREVMEMEQGSIVELDKVAGEQVEVFVNGKLVAKGEVIVIEDKFGVRVTSTSFPKAIQ